MQTLFELRSHSAADPQVSLSKNLAEAGPHADIPFAEGLFAGIQNRIAELMQVAEEFAPGWTYERMDPIARVILLIGAYELLCSTEVPPAVAMNEAIDIAKEFGTPESGKFVNGVLNAIAQAKKEGYALGA